MKITAIYGSPRRQGNTSQLLQSAVAGARSAGAEVTEIVLRDLKLSPCLEIYACRKAGSCAIKDDFQKVLKLLMDSDGLILASPIFFYSVSAHTKILMDRCQSCWVKKYWIDKVPFGKWTAKKKRAFYFCGCNKRQKTV
jgi:multimeric flavodoxin WrbA